MALRYVLLHFLDGTEDILAPEVAECGHPDFRPGLAERLRSIVVAVGPRENRQIGYRCLHWLALVPELLSLDLERTDIIHP